MTGSIGVTGGKFVVSGLMEKLGVTTDTISRWQERRRLTRSTSRSRRARAGRDEDGLMDETYHQFVAKAALGRKMTYAQLDKLAGGRVYTGRQAREAWSG